MTKKNGLSVSEKAADNAISILLPAQELSNISPAGHSEKPLPFFDHDASLTIDALTLRCETLEAENKRLRAELVRIAGDDDGGRNA